MFLSDDLATQVGTFALVPQVVDAVKVPVIAAGGDRRRARHRGGLRARRGRRADRHRLSALPGIEDLARRTATALAAARDDGTALTNLITGRPARGIVNRVMREIGPISTSRRSFRSPAGALAPLRAKAEAQGSGDFSPLWSGQAAALGRAVPARELTRTLAAEAQRLLRALAG